MSLRSRIGRLEARLGSAEPIPKSVVVMVEDGPPIEWETPTGLTLRVPPETRIDPMDALGEEQAALIEPDDDVMILCTPRPGRTSRECDGASRPAPFDEVAPLPIDPLA